MLTARQQHCLRGIGLTEWKTRSSATSGAQESVVEIETTSPSFPPLATPEIPPVKSTSQNTADLSNWQATLQSIQDCRECALAASCNNKVPGKGYQQADLVIVGEAPGHDEDLQGMPFVGRAGQLLDRMLQAIDIDPQQVYITNILKCRPPQNRDPRAEEVAACSRYLQAQLTLIQPRVIFSVGRISAQNLLQTQTPVGKLRGQRHTLPNTDIPLLVTYHPAYLLRNPAEKAKVWQDLKDLHHFLSHEAD